MKLLHLYYDLMNLYGDYANINAFSRILEKNKIEVEIDRLSLNSAPDFSSYSFIFIGSGTETAQKYALSHLLKYKQELTEYINSGGLALLTGNSFEMLGKSITSADGVVYDGPGILDFSVSEQNSTRQTADAVFKLDDLEEPLVGFINKCSSISGVTSPLFKVVSGLSNENGSDFEGIRINNCFGTHLTGPILIKNPHFLKFIAEKATERELKTDYMTYEHNAFQITLENLIKRT